MENAGVQKNRAGTSPSVVRALWDPFGFMQMFGFGRTGEGPLFQVEETDDTYVCKVKVNLTLPDQADVARAKAELHNGELTLVVPKAVMPEAASPAQTSAAAPESPPRRAGRAKGSGKGSGAAARAPRRGSGTRARRGR